MSCRRSPALFLLCLFVLLSRGSSEAPERPADPLTESDVMRSFAAGRPTAGIRAEIESREPRYDLSPEMLVELRAEGLPEELIEAMRRRQTRWNADHVPAPVPVKKTTLRIRLDPGEASTSTLSVDREVSFDVAVAMELGNSPDEREFTGLAIYLACTTPEHVPDQWRTASPLGREAESLPRHEMLVFLKANDGGEVANESKRLKLEVPEFLEAQVVPGTHDIWLGVALEIAGAYRQIAAAAKADVHVPDEGLELPARIVRKRIAGQKTLRIEFSDESGAAKPDEAPQDPDDAESEGHIEPKKEG